MRRYSPTPLKKRFPAMLALLALALLSCSPHRRVRAEGLQFSITLPADIEGESFSGRMFVFLSQRPGSEPINGPDWFHPEPFFALDVKDISPGDAIILDESADGFPAPLDELPEGTYRAQAIFDHQLDYCEPSHGPGNFYSAVVPFEIDSKEEQNVELILDQVIPEPLFPERDWIHEFRWRSELLSDFHSRDVSMLAAVVLPEGYEEAGDRHYPTVYIIPGFGGTHTLRLSSFRFGAPESVEDEASFIRVYLNPVCRWGHHVFANSATNGPWGDALVEELIPAIEAHYRAVADPAARLLTGHSSGGWSSLWLQITYPDYFGGTWSTAPDPVDFRDFQGVNLYAEPPLSLYFDEAGNRRPLARRGRRPFLWYESFGRMDDCLQPGGQLRSFEAVFSPVDEEGIPQRLWEREGGRIDPQVAQAWKAYDIRLILEENWETLAPLLEGKLHIYIGDLDTFYLEGAVRRLAASLQQLESDAEIEIIPGRNHFNLKDANLTTRIRQQMSEAFQQNYQPTSAEEPSSSAEESPKRISIAAP